MLPDVQSAKVASDAESLSWVGMEHIDLPVEVIAEAADGGGGHYLWLRFQRLGDGLEMAMERHLFRLHRRQVAEARRAR